ncbi:MAG: hypothetical protein QOG03_1399 [Actinomycetota bacterium]|jgi:hypothetical protein|nr:hypothetical protein [Actinomycetota bacterium]
MERKVKSGRVTPKGGPQSSSPTTSGRYTPPIPKEYKVSPRWVPVLMFIFLIGGVLVIIGNYLLDAAPGGLHSSNIYLLIGLVMITAGFLTATRYR